MTLPYKRFHVLLLLLVLFPLWWIQHAGARVIAPHPTGTLSLDESDDSDDGDDDDDGCDCDDSDDGDDDDDGDDGDDDDDSDDGDDGDDDDDCDCNDCNNNGIDDERDISLGTSNDENENSIPDECEGGSEPFCVPELEGSPGSCPCGNNPPVDATPEGCLNGDNVGALLTSTGVPSVSNDTFVLHVIGIPNGKPGFFFQGEGDAGFIDFGNGLRCIGGPFIRLAKIAGQPGGNQYPPPGGTPISEEFNIPAGETRYYQVLYRDGQGPCGGTTNTSNGLKVVWGL